MLRRFAAAALLAALPLVGVVAPAGAQQVVPVDFSGPVEAGTLLELRCPAGHQVVRTAGGQPHAAMHFYRRSSPAS